MKKLKEIININLDRIKEDLKEIPNLGDIDFLDIFPTSELHRKMLDDEISKLSILLHETERGNVYLLNEPIKTGYGDLRYIKIRFFDESRLNWEAAADFKIENRKILMKKVGVDSRFSYIKRPEWDAIEFKTNNTLIYFLEPLASQVYNKNGEK